MRAPYFIPSKYLLDPKAFSRTLLLPKTQFPQWNDPQISEAPYRKTTTDILYKWQKENLKGPLFVLHDGPPYANGHLHMGHALNKILKDIINRYQLLRGRKIHYSPGWDCHGLPIESKALDELKRERPMDLISPGDIRRHSKIVAERELSFQRAEFKKFGIMADWTDSGTYRTIDHKYEIRQLNLFLSMVEKGLIYRQFRPVYYSPSSQTALAEAELDYKEMTSESAYVSFKVDETSPLLSERLRSLLGEHKSIELLIWTTTPWTLTANMFIAVNPALLYSLTRAGDGRVYIVATERLPALQTIIPGAEELTTLEGQDLLDVSYLPLFPGANTRSVPYRIVPADFVSADSGTGLVHCAPAHGFEDYHAFLELTRNKSEPQCEIVCHVDEQGCYSEQISKVIGKQYGFRLAGKQVLGEGRGDVLKLIEELGVLVKRESFQHRYPCDWRSKKPVIVTATSQWFTNLDSIKDDALHLLSGVNFFPFTSKTRLQSFVRSRSEWCISRQRVWGVPIPALHHKPSGDAILEPKSLIHIINVLSAKGVDYWFEAPVSEFVPQYLHERYGTSAEDPAIDSIWERGNDTMDVWFDSGTSWTLLQERGIRSESQGESAFADICLEGSDQHRGWFQSQLLTFAATAGKASSNSAVNIGVTLPYKGLVTHGMVLDEDGKKMSKSLGNVISPMDIVLGGKDKSKSPAYGSDVLRYWAASVEFWRDMALGPKVLSQSAESVRKLRNCARFMLGNVSGLHRRKQLLELQPTELLMADRYVMNELYKLEQIVIESYGVFNFPRVVTSLSHFANITLSSFYFDITKDCLYADAEDNPQRRAILFVFQKVLDSMNHMMAPILPYLAEEIHHYSQPVHRERSYGESFFRTPWILLSEEWRNDTAEREMGTFLHIRSSVLALLEKARTAKQLRSSLEADVDLILPSDTEQRELCALIQREEEFIKTLCIVSDARVIDEGSMGSNGSDWVYSGSVSMPESDDEIGIRVRPARGEKCPRCWTYTREHDHDLCERCAEVISLEKL